MINDFVNAWNFLRGNPIFQAGEFTYFEFLYNITPIKVDPQTNRTDHNPHYNTKTVIKLKCRTFPLEESFEERLKYIGTECVLPDNPDLDCEGKTFEEVIIKLANLIWKKHKSFYKEKLKEFYDKTLEIISDEEAIAEAINYFKNKEKQTNKKIIMKNSIIIRKTNKADKNQVQALMDELNLYRKKIFRSDTQKFHERVRPYAPLENEDFSESFIFVVVNGFKEIVGFIQGSIYLREHYKLNKLGYIDEFYLKEEIRGRGIAVKLFLKLESELKKQGCNCISVHTDFENELSQQFYSKVKMNKTTVELWKEL